MRFNPAVSYFRAGFYCSTNIEIILFYVKIGPYTIPAENNAQTELAANFQSNKIVFYGASTVARVILLKFQSYGSRRQSNYTTSNETSSAHLG